jgi:hypothetical protein
LRSLFKRLPSRRLELVFCLGAVLGFFGLAWLTRQMGDLNYWLGLITLEALLPLAVGVVAAGLLAEDPALEILLSAHRPAWQVMIERLLILAALGGLLGVSLTLVASRCGRVLPGGIVLPKDGIDRIFIWLPPMVFCLGLASAAALLRGRMLDGVLAISIAIGASLLSPLQIQRLCAGRPEGTACAGWLACPTLTFANPLEPYWPLNRLLWLALGVGLLAASLALARREEPLLGSTP